MTSTQDSSNMVALLGFVLRDRGFHGHGVGLRMRPCGSVEPPDFQFHRMVFDHAPWKLTPFI